MQVKKTIISILGCGWLGLPVASYLVTQGFIVKGSVRSSEKIKELKLANITPYIVDIDSERLIDKAFLEADVLVITIPSKNNQGFQNLIAAIKKASLKKVIFISATSVYPSSDKLITEEHKTVDTPLASIEKLFLNHIEFDTTILRFGGLFGANRNPGNFFRNGRVIKNPEGRVNMIHQEDCIRIIHRVLESDIATDVFNGCADTHPTRRDFYTRATLNLGLDTPMFEENQPVQMKTICNEKLKKTFNFSFKHADLLNI